MSAHIGYSKTSPVTILTYDQGLMKQWVIVILALLSFRAALSGPAPELTMHTRERNSLPENAAPFRLVIPGGKRCARLLDVLLLLRARVLKRPDTRAPGCERR